jgi:hypothetical protein
MVLANPEPPFDISAERLGKFNVLVFGSGG